MQKEKFLGIEISKVNNMLGRHIIKESTKRKFYEATNKNGWIIAYLAENNDKEIFQRDIEEQFSIRRSTVSNIVQLMEKKGYIQRESVPYDARLKKLTLTPKAEKIYSFMLDDIKDYENKMRQGISDEELTVFFNVLQKIQKNIDDKGGNKS